MPRRSPGNWQIVEEMSALIPRHRHFDLLIDPKCQTKCISQRCERKTDDDEDRAIDCFYQRAGNEVDQYSKDDDVNQERHCE